MYHCVCLCVSCDIEDNLVWIFQCFLLFIIFSPLTDLIDSEWFLSFQGEFLLFYRIFTYFRDSIYCSSSPSSCLIFEKSNSSPVPRLNISKTSRHVVSKCVVASYDSDMKICDSKPLSTGS